MRPRRTRMTHRVTGQDLDAHGWLAEGQDETSTRTDGSPGNGIRTKSKGEIKRTLRMIRLEGDSSDVDHPETFASDGGEGGIRGSHSKNEVRGVIVVSRGFEPLQTEPKPVVLPLHHETSAVVIFLTPQKYTRGAFLQVLGLLFCNQEVVILLSALNEEVFSGD